MIKLRFRSTKKLCNVYFGVLLLNFRLRRSQIYNYGVTKSFSRTKKVNILTRRQSVHFPHVSQLLLVTGLSMLIRFALQPSGMKIKVFLVVLAITFVCITAKSRGPFHYNDEVSSFFHVIF